MPIDYQSSGVSLTAADEAVKRLKSLVASTRNPNVIGDVGLFAGAFRLPAGVKKRPVLLSSTDGVGTKLKVALLAKKYHTIGEDLVNHCVNDLLCNGGDPLFFLDYYACGKLEPAVLEDVVRGLARGCVNNGVALLGGETAEMPGLYQVGDFDLAGTIVGWADEDELILGRGIAPGDVIVGLPSVGLHTNGYSLARRVLLDNARLDLNTNIQELGTTLGDALLEIHPSYLQAVRALRQEVAIKGIAHITGGGLEGNLERVLPEGCRLEIQYGSWTEPPIFHLIRRLGPVAETEMRRVFNLGVGLALILSSEDAGKIIGREFAGWRTMEVGKIEAKDN
jgi:phosphoribosylformylglycinamidine cyclo-ligase